ncbi:hypothetical protein [Azospirillum griseum]|uniref:Uncharacterized protein n=1 Tax=Azospirillum griseum TaxID=2496639 RepID=A0A3S0R991_9PROT|nr:hypothetical protein [Azospirillum griseum]RTR20627.1 hypothetical protein EJ903_10955 [Azospirillum griseum]
MTTRMARVVRMGKLGGYAVLLGGAMLEIDGRMLWPSMDAVMEMVGRHGMTVASWVIDTGTVTG